MEPRHGSWHKGIDDFCFGKQSCDLVFSGAHCHVFNKSIVIAADPLSDCIVCGNNRRLNACRWAQCERLGWRSNMIFQPNSQRAINVVHVAIYCGRVRCETWLRWFKTVVFLSHNVLFNIFPEVAQLVKLLQSFTVTDVSTFKSI